MTQPKHPITHDNCGINAAAIIKINDLPKPKRSTAIIALKERAFADMACADSRGGVTPEAKGRSKYDGKGMGDGAGIMTNIPHALLKSEIDNLPKQGQYGVAHLFFPREVEANAKANAIVEAVLKERKLTILARRTTPIDPEILSQRAYNSMPDIQQMILVKEDGSLLEEDELLQIHGEIEATFQEQGLKASVCSLSKEHITYKGLLRAEQLKDFYPDLNNDLFHLERYVIHTRYSTNSAPDWSAAQPFTIAHNGELNTHMANIFDRQDRERRTGSKRRVDLYGSDTLELSRSVSSLRATHKLSLAQSLLASMPLFAVEEMTEEDKDFIDYLTQMIRPTSGPAHLVSQFCNEKGEPMLLAMRDPGGFRPSNIDLFEEDGVPVVAIGSETRVRAVTAPVKRFSPNSGGMILTNLTTGEVTSEKEILAELKQALGFDHAKYKAAAEYAAKEPAEEKALYEVSLHKRTLPASVTAQKAYWDKTTLINLEALRNGHERLVAMGDDARIPALSHRPRKLTDFLKERFVMVTAPTMDAACETQTINTSVFLGARPQIAEESGYPKRIKLDSPIIKHRMLEEYSRQLNTARLDMTMRTGQEKDISLENAEQKLVEAIDALCHQAEQEVKSGKNLIILSDQELKKKGRVQIPDVLAIAAIHQHLQKKGLRHQASIVAESASTSDSHQASMLLAFGADAVHPYMMYEMAKYQGAQEKELDAIQKGLTEGHTRVLSRLGFNRTLAYIDGRGGVVETLGITFSQKDPFSHLFDSMRGYAPILPLTSFGKMAFDMASQAEKRSTQLPFPEYGADEARAFSQTWIGSFREMMKKNELVDTKTPKSNPDIGQLSEPERRLRYSLDVLGQEAAVSRAVFAMQMLQQFEKRKDNLSLKEKALLTSLSHQPQYYAWIKENFPKIPALQMEGTENEAYSRNPFIDVQRQDSPAWKEFRSYLVKKERGAKPDLSYGIGIEKRHNDGSVTYERAVKEKLHYTKEWINAYRTSDAFKEYAQTIERIHAEEPTLFHHHVHILSKKEAVDIDQVEPMVDVLKRFSSGAMSYGSVKGIAHGDIAEAHNAIGSAGSNDGEGGMVDRLHGTIRNGASKQYASGQFGMSAALLDTIGDDVELEVSQNERGVIEIKIAQGAKPGVGGELPGAKVDEEIATTRRAVPGQTLASPPPIHDLYSIEDLKSLTMAMRSAGKNVSVKLAATTGVGTIAAGVAKAGAHRISIACGTGGTGAAKHFDQKNVGQQGLQGLIEAHNALVKEGLRNNVKLFASGGFQSTKDFLLHAVWADGFETGTIQLGSAGCIAIDECFRAAKILTDHIESGGCSVGITNSQWNYKGKNVEQLTLDFAASLRDDLAKLGFESIDAFKEAYHSQERVGDLVGISLVLPEFSNHPYMTEAQKRDARTALFDEVTHRERTPSGKHFDPKDASASLDFNELKERKDAALKARILTDIAAHPEESATAFTKTYNVGELDLTDMAFGMSFLDKHIGPEGAVENDKVRYRSVYSIFREQKDKGSVPVTSATHYGHLKVAKDAVRVNTEGNAGQRYGSFLAHGVHLHHVGRLHDSVGNDMSGGVISVTPEDSMLGTAHENNVMGNSCFYGASGGEAYINGSVGDRFAIRNSGAAIVVSGNTGAYACEYMTGGSAVFLGDTKKGFGARMTGGATAVFNAQEETLDKRYVRSYQPKEKEPYLAAIKGMLEEQVKHTGSKRAEEILGNWEENRNHFALVLPHRLVTLQEELEQSESESKEYKEAKEELRKIHTRYTHPTTTITPLEQVWLDQTLSIVRKRENKKDLPVNKLLPMPYFAEPVIQQLLEGHKAKHKDYHPKSAIYGQDDRHNPEYVQELVEHLEKTLPKQKAKRTDNVVDIEDLAARKAKGTGKPAPSVCSCNAATCQGGNGCTVGRNTQQGARDSEEALKAALGQYENVPAFVNALLNKELSPEVQDLFNKAYHDYAETSPLLLTGFICPAPCQDACTKTLSGVPVPIKGWESFLSIYAQYYPEKTTDPYFKVLNTLPVEQQQHVAVVGSGPAGLEAALKLARQGLKVTIFEKSDKPGGLATYGIPSEKGVDRLTSYYIKKLEAMGVTFECGREITDKSQLIGFDQAVIATGVAHQPHWLRVPVTFGDHGSLPLEEAIAQGKINGITQAMDLLPEFNKADRGEAAALPDYRGKKVMAIGAGDTGTDVLTSLRKLQERAEQQFEVTSVKRDIHLDDVPKTGTGYPDSPEVADPARQNALKALGAKDLELLTPESIECDEAGNIRAVIFIQREIVEGTEDLAKAHRHFAEGSKVRLETDQLILALGFKTAKGPLLEPDKTGERSIPTYAAGDCSKTAKNWTVVAALADANMVAENILQQMGITEIHPSSVLDETSATRREAAAARDPREAPKQPAAMAYSW